MKRVSLASTLAVAAMALPAELRVLVSPGSEAATAPPADTASAATPTIRGVDGKARKKDGRVDFLVALRRPPAAQVSITMAGCRRIMSGA